MKLPRRLLLALAALVALTALVVGLGLTPAVQQWAVRRALAGPGSPQVEFAYLSVGPTRAELRGVSFRAAGMSARAGQVVVEYSLWEFVRHRRVSIARVDATEWEFDVSRLSEGEARAGAATAPAATPGALLRTRLPWPIVVGEVALRGRVLLPSPAGHPALPAEFQLSGGKIAPGQEGGFIFETTIANNQRGAAVTALHVTGSLQLRQTLERRFDQVGLKISVDAIGPKIPKQHQLNLTATMGDSAEASRYALTVETVQEGMAANLLKIEATAPIDGSVFTGEWRVQANHAQLEPFFLGGALPKFLAAGAGKFGVRLDTGAVAVAGTLEAEASALERIDPKLRPFGALRIGAAFDLAEVRGVSTINKFDLRVDGEQPVLEFETLRPVALHRVQYAMQFGGGSAGEVARLKLHGLPLAWVRPFVTDVDLSGERVSGEFVVVGDPELLRIRTIVPLRATGINLVRDGQFLLERADLTLGILATIKPDDLRVEFGEFALRTSAGDTIRGDLSLAVPLRGMPLSLHVLGSVEADLPHLLEPYLPLGHVQLGGATELRITPGRLEVVALRGDMRRGDKTRVFAGVTEAPFAIDLHTRQLVPQGTTEREFGRVSYGPIDLQAWPIVAAKMPVAGRLNAGTFTMAAQGARVLVRPGSAVQWNGVGWGAGAAAAIEGVRIETWPTAEFESLTNWKISDGATSLRDATGRELATFNAEVMATPQDGVRATLNYHLELIALSGQPALAGLRALSAGRAAGELRAVLLGQTVQAEARTTFNGLVAREGNLALPVANVQWRGLRGADGKLTSEAAVLLDRLGRRSDLAFTAHAQPAAVGWQFQAKLTSEHLELADALGLAALTQSTTATTNTSAPAAPAPVGPVVADGKPLWAGWQGEVRLDLKSVAHGQDWSMHGFTAGLVLTPTQAQLTKVEATMSEKGRLEAQAELHFGAGPRPYALDGKFSLTEFDVGALLKAFEPGRPPVLEGMFTVSGGFKGDGETVAATLERTRGQFQLSSRQGVFRGLQRTSAKVSTATRAVEIGAALGSLFGTNKVKETAEKVAGQAYQIDQLALTLGELPFDQMLIRATREENFNFKIEELSLLSPEVRLTARGTLTHVAGKPLFEHPLRLTYQLGARGKVEQTLARLKALDGTKDELGFAKMRDTGAIRGTLGRPDPTAFFARLAESKLADFLTPGN